MHNKLRYLIRILTALILLFVIHGFAAPLYSQVVFNDNRTKEILFSEQNDRETQSSVLISLNNYSKLLSPGLDFIENDWDSEIRDRQSSAYQYSKTSSGVVHPGDIRIDGIDEVIENAFSIKNASSESFGKLNISTDFVIKNAGKSGEISLVLRVKNSDGSWTDAGRGVFYPNLDEAEETFSVQIAVSDVFIQQNEIVDMMWVNRSLDKELHQLFTQRIEITPQYSAIDLYQMGGLLITEIMPMGDIDGFEFEYLELYNPDGVKKSLKGLTIQSDYGSHTIQSNLEIPPYGYHILSNADLSDVENVENSHFYSGNRLFSNTEPNGRIEITQNGEVIASAVYEAAEKNISFEVERMSQSVDGYTGLQNLKRSATSFMKNAYGSPGKAGAASPIYHKTFTASGVYLITLPGRIYTNMLRIKGTSFYSIKGYSVQLSEIEPFEPVFMIKNSSEQTSISVEGVKMAGNNNIRIFETDSHRYISPEKPGTFRLMELFEDRNTPLPSVIGVWNTDNNRIGLKSAEHVITEIWRPVISRIETDEASTSRSASEIPFNAENSFNFSLFETENDDDEFLVDEVWVEVDDANNVNSVDQKSSFFTKPLFSLTDVRGVQEASAAVLYGLYSGIDKSGLSYFKLEPEKDTYSEFSLGIFNMSASEQKTGILRWDIPENIPEDWFIVLTDRLTGQEIDMQLQESYKFRIQPENEKTTADDSGQNLIRQVNIIPNKRERFIVRFEPPNLTLENEEDSETPGSIELRQNYPNPFNPSTNITFFLPEDRQVRLGIYNIVGQQVATLIDDNMGAGEHSVVWNATNNPSGIYIVQLETGSRILTRKITLVK